jgi:hypothetical protein
MNSQRQRHIKDIPKTEALREDVKDADSKDRDAKDKSDIFLMQALFISTNAFETAKTAVYCRHGAEPACHSSSCYVNSQYTRRQLLRFHSSCDLIMRCLTFFLMLHMLTSFLLYTCSPYS